MTRTIILYNTQFRYQLVFFVHICGITWPSMEPNKSEESGEVYSLDDQGEYMPEVGMLSFSF